MRGPHDVGGLPAGPVDPEAHVPTDWDKMIDGTLMALVKRGVTRPDEMRRCVEQLGAEGHARLFYYERWCAALMRIVIEKGLVTQDEIDARVSELQQSGKAESDVAC